MNPTTAMTMASPPTPIVTSRPLFRRGSERSIERYEPMRIRASASDSAETGDVTPEFSPNNTFSRY